MTLHETQKEVVTSPARFKVLNCGRGWGKTHLAIELILWYAANKSEARVAYIAPTFQQARDISWSRLIKRTEKIKTKANESRLELTIPNTKGTSSTIFLRGWEAVETLRGQEFDYLVLDEVATMRNFKEGWEQVLRPTLRVSRGGVLFISTPKGYNHFFDLYSKAKKLKNWQAFHFTSYDNPHLHIEETEQAKAQLPPDAFAQEYLADFRKQEGLVYKEFDRLKHIYEFEYEVPESIVETLLGIDFGYNNPACILTIKKDFDGIYWVTNEWYKTQKTDAQIAEVAKSIRNSGVYPDPQNAGGVQELKNAGLYVREVIKGKGSVQRGIDRVRELLLQNRIRVHKSCSNLISEFETYAYKEKRDNQNEPEEPIKENDHAMDALRYVIMMNYLPAAHDDYYEELTIYDTDYV